MQRFNLVSNYAQDSMQLSLEGTYVLHSDAQKEIKRLIAIISDLIEDIDQSRDLTILRGCSPYYNARAEVWRYSED